MVGGGYRGYMGNMLYCGYMGILDKKMETTIQGLELWVQTEA